MLEVDIGENNNIVWKAFTKENKGINILNSKLKN